MIERLCENRVVLKCDGCDKRIAEYTVLAGWNLSGWYQLKDYFVVEFGCPQADQDNTHYYCTNCWLKSKDELTKRYYLKDSDVRLVRTFNTKNKEEKK